MALPYGIRICNKTGWDGYESYTCKGNIFKSNILSNILRLVVLIFRYQATCYEMSKFNQCEM